MIAGTYVRLTQHTVENLVKLQAFGGEPFPVVIDRAVAAQLSATPTPSSRANGNGHNAPRPTGRYRVRLLGEDWTPGTVREVLTSVLLRLHRLDDKFLSSLGRERARSRRLVAATPEAIYPRRPDLAKKYVFQLDTGWWIGTNYSWRDAERILRTACRIAGLTYGTDLVIEDNGRVARPSRPIPRLEDL